MSGFLLDTNVVSEMRKRDRANPHFRRWFFDHTAAEFWLSVLVAGELRRGVELIRRRDEPSARTLGAWLESILKDYADRMLPVTIAISQRWAVMSVPDPVPVIDGLLAATALEHSLTFVSRNTEHVLRTGATHVNPFDPN